MLTIHKIAVGMSAVLLMGCDRPEETAGKVPADPAAGKLETEETAGRGGESSQLAGRRAENQSEVIKKAEGHAAAMENITERLELAIHSGSYVLDPEAVSTALAEAAEVRQKLFADLPAPTEVPGGDSGSPEGFSSEKEFLQVFDPELLRKIGDVEANLEKLKSEAADLPPLEAPVAP